MVDGNSAASAIKIGGMMRIISGFHDGRRGGEEVAHVAVSFLVVSAKVLTEGQWNTASY